MDGRADYTYATVVKNMNDFPEQEQTSGRSLNTSGSSSGYTYTLDRTLKGGSEYYVCVGYRNALLSASVWSTGYYTGEKRCIINSIQVYGINAEETELEMNGGRIEVTVETDKYNLVYGIHNNDNLKITGGFICAYNLINNNNAEEYQSGYGIYNKAFLEITGGTFIGKNKSYSSIDGIYKSSGIYNVSVEETSISNIVVRDSYNGLYQRGTGVIYASNLNLENCKYNINNDVGGNISLSGYCKLNNKYIQNKGSIIIENANLDGYIINYKDLKINGGNIAGKECGIRNYEAGNIEINEGTITGEKYGIYNRVADINDPASGTGHIHIRKGLITGEENGIYGNIETSITIGEKDGVADNSQIKITGKTQKGITAAGTIRFYDGVVQGKIEAIAGEIIEVEDGYNLFLEASEEIEEGEKAILGAQLSGIAYVEPNSTVLYDTLQTAIDACGESGTITLVKNIIVTNNNQMEVAKNKNITINLNGREIKAFKTMATNYGNLKLTDLTEEAKGNIKVYSKVGFINESFGQLDIEKIKIVNISNNGAAELIYNQGELNVESGTIEASESNGHVIYNEGKVLEEDLSDEILGEWVNVGAYYFEEVDGKHISNNRIKNTLATSYVKIDLSERIGLYHLTVNTEIKMHYVNEGQGNIDIKDSNTGTSSFNERIYSSAGDYPEREDTIVLQGEKIYYLYFTYSNRNTSYADKGYMIVNSIKIQKQSVTIANIKGGTFNTNYAIYNTMGDVNITGGEIRGRDYDIYNCIDGIVKIDNGSIITEYDWGVGIQNYGKVEMNGGTLTGQTGIYNYKNGNITMTGGTIISNPIISNNYYYYGGIRNYGTFEMTGGEINTTGYNSSRVGVGILVQQDAITQIKGGTITVGNYANGIRNMSTALVKITKVTITGTGSSSYGIYNASTGEIVLGQKDGLANLEDINIRITNGYGVSNKNGSLKFYDGIIGGQKGKSIEGSVTDYEEKYTVSTYKYGETELYEIGSNQEVSLLERIFVAHVASCDTQYEDIYEAIENLADTDTLTILHDVVTNEAMGPLTISANKTIVLDLNGYTIKGNTASIILNKGTLTLKDSQTGGTVVASQEGIHNNGTLTVENGIIKTEIDQTYAINNEALNEEEINTEEIFGELTSAGQYYFEEKNGKYVPNNQGKTYSTAISYMKIDLQDKEGVFVLNVKATASNSSSDYGFVTVSNSNVTAPSDSTTNGRLIYISGSKTVTGTMALLGGKEYYLYFGYKKEGGSTYSNTQFQIESLKIFLSTARATIQGGSIKMSVTNCLNTTDGMFACAIKNTGFLEINGGDIDVYTKNTQSYKAYSIGIDNWGYLRTTGGTIKVEAQDTYRSSSHYPSPYAYGIRNNVSGTVECGSESIKSTTYSGSSTSSNAHGIHDQSIGKIKITDGKIEGNAYYSYGIYSLLPGDIEIAGGTISASRGIFNYETGNIIMTGGTLTASSGVGIDNEKTGTVRITGGTITSYDAGIYNYSNGMIVIGEKDGTFQGDTIHITSRTGYGIEQRNVAELNFYDGTIIGKTGAICGTIKEIEEEYSIILENTNEITDGKKATLGEQLEIAYVEPNSTVLYDNIQEAINACGEEGTVVLVKDITHAECQKGIIDENSNITMDLNGHSIRTFGCVLDNYGTLKLIDTVTESTGSIYGYAKDIIMNENTGIFTNESASINNTFICRNENDWIANGVYNKGKLYVKGGKIEAQTEKGAAIYNKGILEEEINTETIIGNLVSPGEYHFIKDENGKYVSNNDSIQESTAISYLKIDLRDKEGYYLLNVNATLPSDGYYDYGSVIIRDTNDETPVYDDLNGRILFMSQTIKELDGICNLVGGKEYYLYFYYYKRSSDQNGEFTINSIKIFPNTTVANIEGGEVGGCCGIVNENALLNVIDGTINCSYYGIYEISPITYNTRIVNIIGGNINATKAQDKTYAAICNAFNSAIIVNGGTITASRAIYNNVRNHRI